MAKRILSNHSNLSQMEVKWANRASTTPTLNEKRFLTVSQAIKWGHNRSIDLSSNYHECIALCGVAAISSTPSISLLHYWFICSILLFTSTANWNLWKLLENFYQFQFFILCCPKLDHISSLLPEQIPTGHINTQIHRSTNMQAHIQILFG